MERKKRAGRSVWFFSLSLCSPTFSYLKALFVFPRCMQVAPPVCHFSHWALQTWMENVSTLTNSLAKRKQWGELISILQKLFQQSSLYLCDVINWGLHPALRDASPLILEVQKEVSATQLGQCPGPWPGQWQGKGKFWLFAQVQNVGGDKPPWP